MSKKLYIFLDMRVSEEEVFLSFRQTIPKHCGELFSMARISDVPVLIHLNLFYSSHVELVLGGIPLYHRDAAMGEVLQRLEGIRNGTGGKTHTRLTYPGNVTSIVAYMRRLCSSVEDNVQTTILFATSFLSYIELFSFLGDFALSTLHNFYCVSVSKEAVCVGSGTLGAHGSIYHTPPDPDSIRAVLQVILEGPLLGVKPSLVNLKVGTLSIRCKAQRLYLSALPRCCTMSSFARMQEERPGLVFQGAQLVYSPFEESRLRKAKEPAVLVAEAILSPQNVEEACLHDNTWMLSPAIARTNVSSLAAKGHEYPAFELFDAFYNHFQDDVLVCWGLNTDLEPPHQLALQSSCFLAYFIDRSRLLVRQIIPSELRRAILPYTESPLDESVYLTSRLSKTHVELSNRGKDPKFSLDNLLQGGLCVAASQLKSEREYFVQINKLFQ